MSDTQHTPRSIEQQIVDALADRDRLAAVTADLVALVIQYRDDLCHPVTDPDSLGRRLEAINAALARAKE